MLGLFHIQKLIRSCRGKCVDGQNTMLFKGHSSRLICEPCSAIFMSTFLIFNSLRNSVKLLCNAVNAVSVGFKNEILKETKNAQKWSKMVFFGVIM